VHRLQRLKGDCESFGNQQDFSVLYSWIVFSQVMLDKNSKSFFEFIFMRVEKIESDFSWNKRL
jgi:hypothetical protein